MKTHRHYGLLPQCGRSKERGCLKSEATVPPSDCAAGVHKCSFVSY